VHLVPLVGTTALSVLLTNPVGPDSVTDEHTSVMAFFLPIFAFEKQTFHLMAIFAVLYINDVAH